MFDPQFPLSVINSICVDTVIPFHRKMPMPFHGTGTAIMAIHKLGD
jgi:hypothetical protein